LTHQVNSEEVSGKLFQGIKDQVFHFFFINFKNSEAGPCMNRRVYITQIPFIGRKLSVRMHIPFFGEQKSCPLANSASIIENGTQ
jgi:hypothetical protein